MDANNIIIVGIGLLGGLASIIGLFYAKSQQVRLKELEKQRVADAIVALQILSPIARDISKTKLDNATSLHWCIQRNKKPIQNLYFILLKQALLHEKVQNHQTIRKYKENSVIVDGWEIRAAKSIIEILSKHQ